MLTELQKFNQQGAEIQPSQWKLRAAEAGGGSVNHCVWGNKLITDIGAKLFNHYLISKNILYLSDFVDLAGEVLSYEVFIALNHISNHELPSSEYLKIKMAIRRYNNPRDISKNIAQMELGTTVDFFLTPNVKLNGKMIRSRMTGPTDPGDLTQLKTWGSDLSASDIDWSEILASMYKSLTNNFKLLQFQYKLIMRISTCRYMRFKMQIDRDSPNCGLCHGPIESLPHIYLHCPMTIQFVGSIVDFITTHIDVTYNDPHKLFFITCSHNNQLINYINLTAKWYISRQFQNKWPLYWDGFRKSVKMFLHGEKRAIAQKIKQYMQLG